MPKTKTVQLFVTCLIDSFFPHIGDALVRVLNRSGVRVEFSSGQTCCGQPAFNAGLRSQARPLAEHTIKTFKKTTGDIVVPSGSCAAMLRYGYLELFKDDPRWLARARVLTERVHEFTEYLVDVRGISNLGSRWPGKLTYHPSCHLLRLLNVDRQPRTCWPPSRRLKSSNYLNRRIAAVSAVSFQWNIPNSRQNS
jgi:L-lactate dehydrogenase complex protein LldE